MLVRMNVLLTMRSVNFGLPPGCLDIPHFFRFKFLSSFIWLSFDNASLIAIDKLDHQEGVDGDEGFLVSP